MHAFKQSLRKGTNFRFMVYSDELTTLGGLLAYENRYAAADDDNRDDGETRRRESGKKKVEDQAGPTQEVAATFSKSGQGNGKWQDKKPTNNRPSRPSKVTYEDIKNQPCVHHLKADGTCSHINQQCHINRDIAKDPKAGRPRNKRKCRRDGKEKDDAALESDGTTSKEGKGSKFPKHTESLIVNLATDSSRKEKAAWRELNATVPQVPQFLDWSDTLGQWAKSP